MLLRRHAETGFFVGGFANGVAWDSARRRGLSYLGFLRRRLERLLRPTALFLAVWVVVEVILHLTDTAAPGIIRRTLLPFRPLWFLGVYVAVTALSIHRTRRPKAS